MSHQVTGCSCGVDLRWWRSITKEAWLFQHGDNDEHLHYFEPSAFYIGPSDELPPVLNRPLDWKAIRDWLEELHSYEAGRA